MFGDIFDGARLGDVNGIEVPEDERVAEDVPLTTIGEVLRLQNPGNDPNVLERHLASLVELLPSFDQAGYSVDDLGIVAGNLFNYNIFTVRSFVAAQRLFDVNDPVWPVAELDDGADVIARDAACFLQDCLLQWRHEMSVSNNKDLVRPTLPLATPKKRARSSGSNNDKKKKKKSRRRRSSSNTSSSSSSPEFQSDANKLVSKSPFRHYGSDLLPRPKVIVHVACRNKNVKEHGVRYISNEPIEEWVPSYVGRDLPSKERKEKI